MAQKRNERGSRMEGGKRESVTCSSDRENEISKDIYYISSVCLMDSGTRSIQEEALLTRPESKTSQFKKRFKLLLAQKS